MTYTVKASWPGRDDLGASDLAELWRDLESQKLRRLVFYDGRIGSYRDLADWAYLNGNYFAVVYGPRAPGPLGFFWLNGQSGRVAMIHFGFLAAGRPEALAIGRAVLGWCFEGGLSALYGLTPSLYGGVLAYIKTLGFQILGYLPEACPMYRQGRLSYRSGALSLLRAAEFQGGRGTN